MRERSPVPSPLRAAMRPLPLAFAKSCKGGDVSVLDPALAWDDRFIYLFIKKEQSDGVHSSVVGMLALGVCIKLRRNRGPSPKGKS